MSRHTADVGDAFAAHRTEPEATWSIPELGDGDPPLRLAVNGRRILALAQVP